MPESKEVEVIRNEAGRPSLYRTEMCDKVVQYMSEGKTDSQVCALIGISHDSLARYRRTHPEMGDAYEKGKLLQQAVWEKLGWDIATGEVKGNATTYIFMMSNLFKKDYTQKNDQSVTINLKNENASLSDAEIQDRIKQLTHVIQD